MVQKLIDDLKPMFEVAEGEGKWFFSAYQQLWFSPSELREKQHEGRFRWGAQNWQLRDPAEREAQLVSAMAKAEHELSLFRNRMRRP